MHQTFIEHARASARASQWAKAFVAYKTAQGKPYNSIIRALAFKWIRILFRCWKNRVPYSEVDYICILRRRNSPIIQYLKESTAAVA